VDALSGAPGVHSARFAAMDKKENAKDADNNVKLLHLLKDVPLEKRTARFRCVIALVPVPEKRARTRRPSATPMNGSAALDGACAGRIQFSASGPRRFRLRPAVVLDGFTQSFAELGEDVKTS